MAIRIKYDPVGALFLGSYAAGAAQGQERRRQELQQQAQRTAERFQQSRERALDRAAIANRNMVNIGNAGVAAPPVPQDNLAGVAPGLRNRIQWHKDRKQKEKAERDKRTNQRLAEQGRDLLPPAEAPAPADPVAPAAPAPGATVIPPGATVDEFGNIMMDRDDYREYQRQQAAAGQDQLKQWRGMADQAPPEGLDPALTKEYNELRSALNNMVRGKVVDPTLPATQEQIGKIIERMNEIAATEVTPADMANRDRVWLDPKDGTYYNEQGDPSLGRKPYRGSTGEPMYDKKGEEKAQQDAENKEENRRKEAQQLEQQRRAGAMEVHKRHLDMIKSDTKLKPEERLKAMREAQEAFDKQWSSPPEEAVAEESDDAWIPAEAAPAAAAEAAPAAAPAAPPVAPAGTSGAPVDADLAAASPAAKPTAAPPVAPTATPTAAGQPLPADRSQVPDVYLPNPRDRKTMFEPDYKTGTWKQVTDPKRIKDINLKMCSDAYDKLLPEGKTYDMLSPEEKDQVRRVRDVRAEVLNW